MRARPCDFLSFLGHEENKRKKLTATATYVAFANSAVAYGLNYPEAPMCPALMIEGEMVGLTSEF